MTTVPCLRFLRPYAWRPLAAQQPAYLRLYHLARQNELHEANALKYPRLRHNVPPMRIPDFRQKYKHIESGSVADEEIVLRGRIQHVRRASSKLMFVELKSDFEHVQGLCNFRKVEAGGVTLDEFKAVSKMLARGDIVSLQGRATRTKTGELSIDITRLPELLSPNLVPLPVKLGDEYTKIQKRHVDLLVNPETVDILRMRAFIIKSMRDFFHQRDFLEFQTPVLAEIAGGAAARPFVTSATEFPAKELALRIAPELWLKRLVVGGIDKVFEIGPAFRNEGVDSSHNPEFTMCEYYNAYANLEDLIRQTEDLIIGMAQSCQDLILTKLTSLPTITLSKYARPFNRVEFIPGLESRLGFSLPNLANENTLDELRSLLKKHDIPISKEHHNDSLPRLLDRLAGMFLEPASLDGPLFITHHPVCMSPLSKSFTCPQTGQIVSARTELFVEGRELANMYEEENDPVAQRQKFVDQAARLRGTPDEAEATVIDESYIKALESGLPPTGGWGCGIERLVMLFSGARRISDCLSFGNLRNVVSLSTNQTLVGDDARE